MSQLLKKKVSISCLQLNDENKTHAKKQQQLKSSFFPFLDGGWTKKKNSLTKAKEKFPQNYR